MAAASKPERNRIFLCRRDNPPAYFFAPFVGARILAETVASCYGDTNIRKKEAGGQNLAYLVQRNQTDSCPSVFMEMQKKSLLEKFLSPARNGAEPRLFILNDEMLTGISYIHNEEQNQVAFAVVVSDKAARARAGKTISSYSGVFESWDTGDEVVCMYVQNISPIYGYRHRKENLEKLLRDGIRAVHSYAGVEKED